MVRRKVAKIQSRIGTANARMGNMPSSAPPSRKLAEAISNQLNTLGLDSRNPQKDRCWSAIVNQKTEQTTDQQCRHPDHRRNTGKIADDGNGK